MIIILCRKAYENKQWWNERILLLRVLYILWMMLSHLNTSTCLQQSVMAHLEQQRQCGREKERDRWDGCSDYHIYLSLPENLYLHANIYKFNAKNMNWWCERQWLSGGVRGVSELWMNVRGGGGGQMRGLDEWCQLLWEWINYFIYLIHIYIQHFGRWIEINILLQCRV